jgi:CRISPR-associated protein Csh2
MENNTIINENSDFLFIYDATLCNPNGDPDQENKPRMDYDTDTNLVTDTRVKRSIRDYLKATGEEIFVDMEGENKVSPDSKLKSVINRILADESQIETFFGESDFKEVFIKIIKDKKDSEPIFKALQDKKNLDLNSFILEQLVKQKFIDIRMFGSAFAIGGFSKAYTGPIQLNWGYSLHKVDLVDSNTIVTTMNDDNSTFGKDYRVHYSMLAFNGTINKHVAKSTGLTVDDLNTFRKMIWESIAAMPTRSKLNQYAKLYVEIVYNDGFSNGHFGDLRNLITTNPSDIVRKIEDVNVDMSKLMNILQDNKGEDKAIKEVIIRNQLTDDKI